MAALATWGLSLHAALLVRVLAAAVAVIGAAVLWGLFVAPGRPRALLSAPWWSPTLASSAMPG